MQTMHPCIMLGSYTLDRDRLPDDEFRSRMEPVYRLMDQRGLAALLVYGDALEHGALAYLSNFIPRMRWAMALFPRHGEPRLLCSMSSRDVPAMRAMTWIGEVYSGWEWKWFDDWLAKLQTRDGPAAIGAVEFGRMTPTLYRSVERSLGNRFRLQDQADIATGVQAPKRPRELSIIRSGCEVTALAARQLAEAWRGQGDPERAALAAERAARMAAAQDVRTLVSLDNGVTLRPYRGTFDARPTALTGYIAVKLAGYWSDAFVTLGCERGDGRTVTAALHAMIAHARVGTKGSQLHAIAHDALAGAAAHPALDGSVGRRIGLSLHEGEALTENSSEELRANQVYSLHVGTQGPNGGCFASAVIAVRSEASPVLLLQEPECR